MPVEGAATSMPVAQSTVTAGSETSDMDAAVTPRHGSVGDEPIRSLSSPAAKQPQIPQAGVSSNDLDYTRVIGALGIVIGLIFAVRWAGRLFFPSSAGRGGGRAVEVLSRSPLSPKQQVMLLRVGRRLLVVGDNGSQMNALCEISDPDEIAALVGQLQEQKTATGHTAFGAMFGRFSRRFDRPEPEPERVDSPLVDDAPDDEAPVASAREELNGLRERVRLLARQFKSSA